MAYAFKRGKSFYICFRDETGKWVQRSTDAANLTEARRLAAEKEIRDERIRLGLDHHYPMMKFSALAEMYLKGVVPSRRSFKTIEGRIRNHLMPTLGDKYLGQVLSHDINMLLIRKRDEGLSVQTSEAPARHSACDVSVRAREQEARPTHRKSG